MGQIAEVTPVCNGFELESEIINLCMTTLEICLQTDSLVSTADLDVLPSLLKMDSDAILVTDFVQNEGSCIYQILKQPVFETSPTCAEVLKNLAKRPKIVQSVPSQWNKSTRRVPGGTHFYE